mmetsp:Transcript_32369/g.74355  ORF Transcript_32369/g.74355 Transcript_32369/m.74355 type:complete len:164 (-) Transcript_32369:76-567(-)
MQFLTSAFLLPYLVTRTSEEKEDMAAIAIDDLNTPTQIVEKSSRWILAPLLGIIGMGSWFWAIFARSSTFGNVFGTERWESFVQLMSIDRVGASFIVDLVLFGIFQGWLVDDDLQRRIGTEAALDKQYAKLRKIAKYIPFFGLVTYILLRPNIPATNKQQQTL